VILRTLALCTVVAVVAAGTASAGTGEQQVSSNWAGYAAIAPDSSSLTFANVTGSWTVPKVKCSSSRTDAVAFWVGLGGYSGMSNALEQLGTAAECNGLSLKPSYYAWWEIVPAASIRLSFKVSPGDRITAAVAVEGQKVVLSMRNRTHGTRFSKVQTLSQELDATSAEWIAEAPERCSSPVACTAVPLTRFGGVTFTDIAATGNEHPGTLSDTTWTATPIELIAGDANGSVFDNGDPLGPGVGAVPGPISADGRSFAVSWQHGLQPPG
jgi:hypothetical protein